MKTRGVGAGREKREKNEEEKETRKDIKHNT